MPGLINLTIDTGVLVPPHLDCAPDDVAQYVERLISWRELLDGEKFFSICMSAQAHGPLTHHHYSNLSGNKLQELFDAKGITEYNGNTVSRAVFRFLDTTPSFEDYYKVRYVLSEHIEVRPDITRNDSLHPDFPVCLALIAILCKHCSENTGIHLLILEEAPEPVIGVRAQIDEIEHSRDDLQNLPTSPAFFEGDVQVCDSTQGLMKCLSEEQIAQILVNAPNDDVARFAIRLYLSKYSIEHGEELDNELLDILKVGSQFREICQEVCGGKGVSFAPKVLRAIAKTARNEDPAGVHALRSRASGGTPQITRNGYKAWRRNIDKACRLHFWRKGRTIELASVTSEHDDFSIPDPSGVRD